MMTGLKQIQDSFQQYLLQSDSSIIVTHVVSTEKFHAVERLAIYANAYKTRLLEALSSTFPFLRTCLGDDEFNAIAATYIDKNNSCFRSIRWYGDRFPDFIQLCDLSKSFPYLHEIAQLDWIMTLVFDAQDAKVFTLEQISLIPPDAWAEMHFIFHPSMHRFQFHWNVIDFWQSTLNEDSTMALTQHSSPITWLFWRHELISHFNSMPNDEAWALDAAISDSSFADICEGLCQFMNEDIVAIAAATMLKKWVTIGVISEISY